MDSVVHDTLQARSWNQRKVDAKSMPHVDISACKHHAEKINSFSMTWQILQQKSRCSEDRYEAKCWSTAIYIWITHTVSVWVFELWMWKGILSMWVAYTVALHPQAKPSLFSANRFSFSSCKTAFKNLTRLKTFDGSVHF